MRRLPDDYRRPLELWSVGGLSCDEIVSELKISTSIVKVRTHRDRHRLAELLGDTR